MPSQSLSSACSVATARSLGEQSSASVMPSRSVSGGPRTSLAFAAKIKAKKGDKEYDNKASLNPETGERRKRSESSDKKREALPLGKRVSADGSVYYENRLNRGDISKEDKFKTGGEIMEKNKEWNLTVRFKNGSSYSYYGDTKKEALDKYKKAFGDFKGVTNKEWELVDKFEGGGEISENNSGWGLKFLKW